MRGAEGRTATPTDDELEAFCSHAAEDDRAALRIALLERLDCIGRVGLLDFHGELDEDQRAELVEAYQAVIDAWKARAR